MRGTLSERFEAKFKRRGPDECWVWNAARSKAGYGQIGLGYTVLYAHRVAYELHYGPIPAGLEVCHRCDNPPCVNPNHLFLGTHAENINDAKKKGRLKNDNPNKGEKCGTSKLSEKQVLEIRASSGTTTEIAARFGVDRTTIGYIRNRKTWRHI